MNIIKLPLDFFVTRLENKEPFGWVRYGDGEMQAVLGMGGRNCDGTEYTPELGAALRSTLKQPRDYLYAIGPKVTTCKNEFARQALDYLERYAKVTRWHDTETILNASLAGELRPLIDALRKRRVMLVGAAHLKTLPLDPQVFIEVSATEAWQQYDKTYFKIMENAYRVNVILFCAGMSSKIILYDVFPHLGKTHMLIDIGSTWDVYCGKLSRSYARRMDATEIERLKELNFGQDARCVI